MAPDAGRLIRLQPLRAFTVRVLSHDEARTVGTGFAVAPKGHIITCRHVVLEAAPPGSPPESAPVNVTFAGRSSPELRRARWLVDEDGFEDDIAVLELTDGPPPLPPSKLARIGPAGDVTGHEFRAYGYKRRADYPAGRARGVIAGDIEAPDGARLRADPLELESSQIGPGMSGAAVLDVEDNRVIGVISETWFPDASTKDRDAGFAVHIAALGSAPGGIELTEAPVPLTAGPSASAYEDVAAKLISDSPGADLRHAPPRADLFVGREQLLDEMTAATADPEVRSIGLVGFGGEGKSALLRRVVDEARARGTVDGAFWWTFDASRGVEQFFDAALTHFTGGRAWEEHAPGPGGRSELLAALLDGTRRHALVLDGLEAFQLTEADTYGQIVDPHLRQFLQCSMVAHGLVVLGSRVPSTPLIDFSSYRFWDLGGLSPREGTALLRALGVNGPTGEIEAVVKRWGGHALILTLLGGYAATVAGGDVRRIADLPMPVSGEPAYEHLNRLLRNYERVLTPESRAVLLVVSAFRAAVPGSMLRAVCRELSRTGSERWAVLRDDRLAGIVEWLCRLKILRGPGERGEYWLHSLLRDHFRWQLQATEEAPVVHAAISDAFAEAARTASAGATLEQLTPALEHVFHECMAGRHDRAYDFYRSRVDRGRGRLLYQLGMYGVELDLMREFFADRNVRDLPLLSDHGATADLLRRVGLALMTTGRLDEALDCDDRSAAAALEQGDEIGGGRAAQVAGEALIHLGRFREARRRFRDARGHYDRAPEATVARSLDGELWGVQNANLGPGELTVCCLAYEAWIDHLRGRDAAAEEGFARAVEVLNSIDGTLTALVDLWGVYQVDVLLARGDHAEAARMIEDNLDYSEENGVTEVVSQCRRQLGDVAMAAGDGVSARAHYAKALDIARQISHQAVRLEALIAMARWECAGGSPEGASALVDDALEIARPLGYAVYECDALVVGARAAELGGETERSGSVGREALELAVQLGYEPARILAAAHLERVDRSPTPLTPG